MKKLQPKHVRRVGYDLEPVWDDVARVLENPNYMMTKSDFLERITWQAMLNYNAFIYIERDKKSGRLVSLYPVSPQTVEFLESDGRLYVQMWFKDGTDNILPYDNFIHIKTHYSVNDFMGGNEYGQPDNDALLKTLNMNNNLLEGVEKALESSFAVNGIVKYNTMLDDGSIEAGIADFENKLANSQSGILGLDMKSDFVQWKRDLQLVDDETLKFIDSKILRHFGVPPEILTGNYSSEVYEAWYQRTLEPLIINFAEAFTKRLFTATELSYGHRVYFYSRELNFMSIPQVIEMVRIMGDRGALFENEIRSAFGYEPLEELKGKRMMSLNYVNVDDAQAYQLKGTDADMMDSGSSEGGNDGNATEQE